MMPCISFQPLMITFTDGLSQIHGKILPLIHIAS